ncbi:MAG: hypothetical protein IPM68_19410 [Flavobacteriales bacterium]|nr:hypothetical protein [Flavobacteriales bacterium]
MNRPGGGHIVSGQTTSSNNGDVGTNHAMGTSDAWIVALDAGGTILWQRLIGGTLNEDATMIHATSDGGTVFTGTATSIDGDLVQNNGGSDLLVAKLDANGGLQWARTYGGSNDDHGFKVIELAGGGYVALGQTRSPDGDVVGHHGNVDTWVIGLDGSGQLLWQRAWGGTEFDRLRTYYRMPAVVSSFRSTRTPSMATSAAPWGSTTRIWWASMPRGVCSGAASSGALRTMLMGRCSAPTMEASCCSEGTGPAK